MTTSLCGTDVSSDQNYDVVVVFIIARCDTDTEDTLRATEDPSSDPVRTERQRIFEQQ